MARTTKKPEERKNELMDAAQHLFLEKGYENTAVSDIVRQINVAQGTFYYHFKSKSEILDAVIDRFISAIEIAINEILNDTKKDIIERIKAGISSLFDITNSNPEIIDYIHQESNALLHDRIVKMTMDRLIPLFSKAVSEGRDNGRIDVMYPEETVEIILSALFWQFHQPGLHGNPEKLSRVLRSLEVMLDRLLGVSDHTFTLCMVAASD